MKRTDELEPGDVTYECVFDSDYDDEQPITPEEVRGYIEKFVVIHHAAGMFRVSIREDAYTAVNALTGDREPACYLHRLGDPDTLHAMNEDEAIQLALEWLEKCARVQAADAAVLRSMLPQD